jgi:hypothetical protein
MWVAFLHSFKLLSRLASGLDIDFQFSPWSHLKSRDRIRWGVLFPFTPLQPGWPAPFSFGLADISTCHTWLIEFWNCTDTVWSIPDTGNQDKLAPTTTAQDKRNEGWCSVDSCVKRAFFHTYIHIAMYCAVIRFDTRRALPFTHGSLTFGEPRACPSSMPRFCAHRSCRHGVLNDRAGSFSKVWSVLVLLYSINIYFLFITIYIYL